jgi:hypothetical protein
MVRSSGRMGRGPFEGLGTVGGFSWDSYVRVFDDPAMWPAAAGVVRHHAA